MGPFSENSPSKYLIYTEDKSGTWDCNYMGIDSTKALEYEEYIYHSPYDDVSIERSISDRANDITLENLDFKRVSLSYLKIRDYLNAQGDIELDEFMGPQLSLSSGALFYTKKEG